MDVIPNACKDEEMSSFLPKIFANLQLLDDIVSNTILDSNVICKQIVQDKLPEAEVKELLEDATPMVSLTHDTAKELRIRLLQTAAAINKGENKQELMETELSPKMLAHYAGRKPKEYDEVVTHTPDSLNRLCPEKNHLQNVMKKAAQLDVLYKLKNSLKKLSPGCRRKGNRVVYPCRMFLTTYLNPWSQKRFDTSTKSMRKVLWRHLRPHLLV